MELKKITSRVFYYPHQPETDRPMLAYLNGDKIALAIDAGNSADHVDEFYKSLEIEDLKKPDFTVITHWHWIIPLECIKFTDCPLHTIKPTSF